MNRIRKIARWLRNSRMQRTWSNEFLWPSRAMWSMLERERLRTMRNGNVFSLLVLHPVDDPAPLVSALEQRLRLTDIAGHLRRQQIGVFLPDTPQHGARRVARDVLAMMPAEMANLKCQIYVFPEPESSSDDSHDDEGIHLGEHEQLRPATLAHAEGQLHGHASSAAQSAFQASPLGLLFVQPLPAWKRMLDILGAATGLLLFSPVIVGVAAAVKLTSPGPVLFAQRRAGLGGRPFTLWKFRTMVPDAERRRAELLHLNEQDGPAFKIKADPRITAIGRILRRTSLDELPQLWNVLWGEMSLVGPRPLPVGEAAACSHWQQQRIDVTPGLTCIWQIHGRSSVQFDEWMRMDLRYARRRSLWRDLKLIAMTIPAVLSRRGAN